MAKANILVITGALIMDNFANVRIINQLTKYLIFEV